MPDPPLRGLRFALVGPGRVGTSLARWSIDAGARLDAVLSRHPARPLDPSLAAFEAPHWHLDAPQALDLDWLLVAVSDDAITPVARRLSRRLRADVALHTSGSLDSSALAPLASRGVAVGSIHPLRAFPRPLATPGDQPFFALDGDPPAQRLARQLVRAFGGTAATLEGPQRRLYHLAASLAAGGVMTVLAAVDELRAAADLPADLMPSFFALTRGALDAVDDPRQGVAAAITGPAARGDHTTVQQHLIALQGTAPQLLPLVERLHAETARLIAVKPEPPSGAISERQGAGNTDPQENGESDS